MTSLLLITVVGATGSQGGSVVRSLIATRCFKVRAVARDPSSKAAKALAANDVDVVFGDYDAPSSLMAAFTGSFGAFLVTSVWNPLSGIPDTNYTQGKTLVDAAKSADVKFLNKIEQYIKELEIPAAFVSPGFYMSNWNNVLVMGAPTRTKDGQVVFETPFRADVGLPLIDIDDLGKFVTPLFMDIARYNRARVLASVEYLSVEQMAAAYGRVTGENVTVILKDPPSFPHPAMTNAALGCSRYGYYGGEPLQPSHRLYDNLRLNTLEDWIRRTRFLAK